MELCQEDSSAYWKGLWHGMLLLLPVLTFLYRKWKVSAERSVVQQPVLGTYGPELVLGSCRAMSIFEISNTSCYRSFMNELFAFEVVLVAGAELKAVRDQLKAAEEATPVNDKKVQALKERSVSVIKNQHADTSEGEAIDESKKDNHPGSTPTHRSIAPTLSPSHHHYK
ncbi:hypothetical protein PC116_g5155 [Phytophthora cactorum]|uniref:Uncharacterized protein n=1 Tax=Phytophthora cactorum TaxID=29920 RepID=A0A8T1DIE0_9STRA|nr:hypothetical protein PC112_g9268 [Phytophthora cactorum]KAG2828898.1 hypothetical protein PC111_g7987 [Phytophthora cactorum]KAG2866377.1 hypothetical protein PC113_g2893 [Phytophthora cactorum]KAG2928739.1 hypothetical protein PC114_g2993 [Phytophthora cactorum]KAG2940748.1 hypothetical protein PC115_g2377 [Phytophthora cactorum]